MFHMLATWAKRVAQAFRENVVPAVGQDVPADVVTLVTNPERLILGMFTRMLRGELPSAAEVVLLVVVVALAVLARHLQATQLASIKAATQNA